MKGLNLEQIAFEIVAYSGDARSKLLQSIKEAKEHNLKNSEKLIKEAEECLTDAHKAQTELLVSESQGNHSNIGFLILHAQDHLMTTLLLKDIIYTLLDVYR
ncbi:PTS lactose/cellobiose transporter subunit IIA (plasmid) [Clostridium perfringens]|uniref:PTS system lactose-specific EIIA component n=1 Tax=Clostridium perfringens E str. JGS1987 TaxID=451755 RepID=B1BU32_CLOPF|nr:PTS lactose/cellobiose transporter subunit IIA [Clostridium perfringens]EDT14792.1 lactose-specific phosphotransferase enzyme iia component [Clostridium perfringens E str. JGS1987]ELC8333000.1 PTS lactose/cellobiose transporter subunit IIA [Clostridium perfringens]ELC8464189.1 PTS lactose/cellobiose transporter subunit IIA [Clostridium perfringens]MDK0553976.1 PTS lactose/cellobiose transporter subunit IIA [Clostridium perfringens]MDT7988946.1 PTS lactose/cellobiose transporter subunit IIA 